jgi:hypothetical protein
MYERYLRCPHCSEWRFFEHARNNVAIENIPDEVQRPLADEDDVHWLPYQRLKPSATYQYIPLIHRLRLLYADAATSNQLQDYPASL